MVREATALDLGLESEPYVLEISNACSAHTLRGQPRPLSFINIIINLLLSFLRADDHFLKSSAVLLTKSGQCR